MPYIVASIITAVTAMIILLTRYEADDSAIMSKIDKMKTMMIMVDGFVNTYIQSGGVLSEINFEVLEESNILINGCTLTPVADDDTYTGEIKTTIKLPNDDVVWQIIPNKDDSSSYKLLVDMTGDKTLMSKAIFSESFVGREYCEKMLFAKFETLINSFDAGTSDFVSASGTKTDGKFVCIVYK